MGGPGQKIPRIFCTGLIRPVQKDTWDFFFTAFWAVWSCHLAGRRCAAAARAPFCYILLPYEHQNQPRNANRTPRAPGKHVASAWQTRGKPMASPPFSVASPPQRPPFYCRFLWQALVSSAVFIILRRATMRRGGLAHPAADRLLEFYQKGFDNLASLQKGFENVASLSCSILLGCLLKFYWHAFYTLRGGMPDDLDTSLRARRFAPRAQFGMPTDAILHRRMATAPQFRRPSHPQGNADGKPWRKAETSHE